MKKLLLSACITFPLVFVACGDTNNEPSESNDSKGKKDKILYADKYPEVLKVKVAAKQKSSWQFNVTLSSTYDTRERYADAWRVLDSKGKELGIRILGHDHANEQPFTRSKTITIPDNITTVFVEGRDKGNGWSGQRFEVKLVKK